MKPRQCQWCGEEYTSAHPAKLYCSSQCKNDMGNLLAVIGKRIAANAMLWRQKRGRKGSGAQALKRLAPLLDEAVREFSERRPKGAPSLEQYVHAMNVPNGIRSGMDR